MRKFARILAILLAALLWQSAARADLDDIRRAAEAGNADAQLELGILFQYGFNFKDNEIPALTWYILSANQGNAKAAKLRDALKAKMTEKDAQEAAEQAASFKPTVPAPAAAAPVMETKQPVAAEPQAVPARAVPETQPAAEPTAAPEATPAESPATAPPAETTPPEPAPTTAPQSPASK
jgi:hypothetical protein